MDGAPATASSRFRIRLSVRGLMVFVLIVGGGAGWYVHRARMQRDAVMAIERVGATVTYDWEWDKTRRCASGSARMPWPKWLVDAVGIDSLSSVAAIEGRGTFTDKEMAAIGELRYLRTLHLLFMSDYTSPNIARVTDAGMANLAGLTDLESFSISGPQITDNGLAHLRHLVNLRSLMLHRSRVTSQGLLHLRAMTNLECLDVTGAPLDSIEPVRHLTKLTTLDLSDTGITDAGLAPVSHLTKLQTLRLAGTSIGDAGIAHLRGMSRVRWLFLEHSRVSDRGLQHIAALTQLTTLDLSGTSIGDASIPFLISLSPSYLIVSDTRISPARMTSLHEKAAGMLLFPPKE